MASFQAYCSACGKTVTVITGESDEELRATLPKGAATVFHVAPLTDGRSEDHRWELSEEEKTRLKRKLDEGMGL
jgi:hypothetical protein